MRSILLCGIVLTLLTLAYSEVAQAAISGVERVASGLNFPGFATHAPGDNNRLFVTELGGNIKVVDLNTNSVLPTPFLNIPDTDAAGEGGILGMAFHPNYFAPEGTSGRGKFYVYVTVDNGGDTSLGTVSPFSSRIREYSVLGDPATSNIADPDPNSRREILSFVQPQSNHNGGWIGFNPQVTPGQPQYLYIASGDGGGSYDADAGHTSPTSTPPAPGNAQDITNNLLGKMLRIDVNDPDPMNGPNYAIPPTNPFVGVEGDDEIFAYGLRNPFRNGFDRKTGDLWIGDVGQGQREEIDFLPASATSALNYGWRLREGTLETNGGVGGPYQEGVHTQPVYDYGRGSGILQGETVIGGYRYRGPDPSLQGRYIFGDASDDNVWIMTPTNPVGPGGTVVNIDALLGNLTNIDRVVSFAEDAKGNLYIIDMATGPNNAPNANTGEIYRIATNELLLGDYDANGKVDSADFDVWQGTFGTSTGSRPADGNVNGIVDTADYVIWRKNFGSSVFSSPASSAAVPEPAAWMLLAVAAIGMLVNFRRKW